MKFDKIKYAVIFERRFGISISKIDWETDKNCGLRGSTIETGCRGIKLHTGEMYSKQTYAIAIFDTMPQAEEFVNKFKADEQEILHCESRINELYDKIEREIRNYKP